MSPIASAARRGGRTVVHDGCGGAAMASSGDLAADSEASWSGPSMGGRLEIRIAAPAANLPTAERAAARLGRRVAVWASRITRFSATSELARLNAAPQEPEAVVRPTLAAVLNWAGAAARQSGGALDVTLLAARLAAEDPIDATIVGAECRPFDVRPAAAWSVAPFGRMATVRRPPGTMFDLDGVAKGWIADRAAALLGQYPGALVDADGDISLHVTPGTEWFVGVADPQAPDGPFLGTLRFANQGPRQQRFGIATSGTNVHRWHHPDGRVTHHLIDPRTLRPAVTDLAQVTVVGRTAREAEVLAKSAVILGSVDGMRLLEESSAIAAIMVKESGEIVMLRGTDAWLA